MHFCENPMDVLDYYGFVDDNTRVNEFAEVEALDDCVTDNNKKFSTKKLKIGAKLGIAGLVKAFVDFTLEKIDTRKIQTNARPMIESTETGKCIVSINTGDCSAATNTGNSGFAIATGIEGKARGALGCYIAVAEWKKNDEGIYELVGFRSHKVDGKTIKENTFYTLKNGEFVEVKGE